MRNLKQFALFAVLFLALGVTTQARDPGDAWPWGSEMPFPWKGIKGTWLAQNAGSATYFTFKKIRTADGANQLQVKEYDAETCKLLASGAGYEEDRVVKAMLLSRTTAFELTVHVFRQSDLKDLGLGRLIGKTTGKTVTVMNMTSVSDPNQRVTVELEKVDVDPAGICK